MVIAVDDFELAFIAVPNTAGTAVQSMLTQLAGTKPTTDDDGPSNGARHWPRFREDRFNAYQGFFRFTLIRDPIQRLLSVYTELVQDRDDLPLSLRVGGQHDVPMCPGPDFFFQNLAAYMGAVPIIKQHAMKQVVFTGTQLDRYDRVYRARELRLLRDDLNAMTGRNLTFTRPNRPKSTLDLNDLAPATQAAIRSHTEADYAAMSQWFKPPWKAEELLSAV